MPGKGKKPISLSELEGYVGELRATAAKLSEFARQMRGQEIKTLDVMGQKTADLGLTYFSGLIQSCERELRAKNLQKKRA